jgi:hypothetical protein
LMFERRCRAFASMLWTIDSYILNGSSGNMICLERIGSPNFRHYYEPLLLASVGYKSKTSSIFCCLVSPDNPVIHPDSHRLSGKRFICI